MHVEKTTTNINNISYKGRSPFTCECSKTVQKRNYPQHCSSKHHINYFLNKNRSCSIIHLTSYLREYDLRSNRQRIQTIVEKYNHIDPYTKTAFQFNNQENLPDNFHIDHIHEAQILACAIKHTPEIASQNENTIVLRPLRQILNNTDNLTITAASINQSKGQAIRYFLGNYEINKDISLLAAFIQTANGKERSIARFAVNIIDLIKMTSSNISDSIRSTRLENNHLIGHIHYEYLAEQFDTIIERMKLDWNENIKLRNGKIYQAYQ